ncbi:hypothetical protein CAP36_17520 [Chitinophagaceae bacterium IBVUCB2]|nr:hypothetical protein CAP36_17520 [Chitinophagaceae bacterium IBVUCB2]
MRKLLWLLPVAIILCACPFESKVPLAAAPVEPVDTTMFGYWYGIVKDGSDFFGIEALDITKQSDSTYSIIRYGKAIKGDIILPDTAYFTGYTSYVGDTKFMNVETTIVLVENRRNKQPIITKEKVYYMAKFEMRNDTLQLKTISESFSPTKKIFNTPDQLKTMVTDLLAQKKNIYDDLYSLSYRKIPKPQPFKSF